MARKNITVGGQPMTWEDPPPRHPYDWDAIRTEVERAPMKWLLVFEKDRQTLAVTIRNNGLRALRRAHGIEVRTANNTRVPPLTCKMWVRYNPEKDERTK